MSVREKAERLRRFLEENKAFANVPALTVRGRPVTLREALEMLEAGRNVEEVMLGLSKLGLDLPWELAEEFYRRLAAARPELKIYALQAYVPAMSPAEALEHIRARDEVGRSLVEMYAKLLNFIRLRVDW